MTTKVCTKCERELPLSEYYKAKDGKYGVRGDCKGCVKLKVAAWNAANAERRRTRDAEYRLANREHRNARNRRRHHLNREAYNARSRMWYRDNEDKRRAYANANKDRYADHAARRRARLRGNDTAPYSRTDVFTRDGYVCRLCGDLTLVYVVTGRHPLAPTIDHIVPVSRGGADTLDNVQTAHRRCNTSKGNRV